MEGMRTQKEGAESLSSWRVAEQFEEAKDAASGSEDRHVVAEHCIAVLDGVSSRGSTERIYGLTAGQFAARIGAEVLSDRTTNSQNVVERLTNTLHTALGGYALHSTPSFVFAAFFPKEHVIVRVGDCSYLIDESGHNPGIAVDRARAVMRRRALMKLKQKGFSDEDLLKEDPTRERNRSLRSWQEHYSNNPATKDFGYGVINGAQVPEDYIERIAVSADAKNIVLASDGYPPETLRMTLKETEEALRELQEKDPLGIDGEPSVRAHRPIREGQTATDDRTYLRIERV